MNHHNADPRELDKFSELAHSWWDPNGAFRPLHVINPERLGWIKSKTSLKQRKIIDIGCGGGLLSEAMATEGGQVTGIDLSASVLSVAQLHLLESGQHIDYQHTSAENFAKQHPNSYDIVTCMEMLEHVPDPASTIAACAALAKPGAHLFFSTINRNLRAYLFAVIGAEYLLRLLPRGTHHYEKFIKPSELSRWAKNAGLEIQSLIGMHYNPLNHHCTLTSDTRINYLIHAIRTS